MTSKQYKAIHFLEEARNHFDERRDYVIRNLRVLDENGRLISKELPNAYGWDTIRHLVCWSYECVMVSDLPDDKRDEINQFAIDIIDKVYDKLYESLESVARDQEKHLKELKEADANEN